MKYGIIIAGDGTTLEDEGARKFDSREIHLPVDFESDPKHYDVKTMAGGTALSVVESDPNVKQETLLTVNHNYGYTPFVFAYFYVISYNGSTTDPKAGGYSDNFYPYSGSSGTVQDFITFRVDNTKMQIVHYLTNFAFGPAYTSDANKYQMRIKYYIAPIDCKVTAYSGERDRIIV